MYSGLREKLLGKDNLETETLMVLVGEKKLLKGIKNLNPNDKYVFVYRNSGEGGDYVTYKDCHFDSGEIHPDKDSELIYFKEPKIIWNSAPIYNMLDIIPINSIQEEESLNENLKLFTFSGNDGYVQIIHNNPVEAWASNSQHEYHKLQSGIWKNRLSEIEQITTGMNFRFEDHMRDVECDE